MSKRRITGICLAILTCAVCATGANAALKDGTYETQAMGNNGNIVFKTTIRDGKIASVEVLKSEETPLLGQGALESSPKPSSSSSRSRLTPSRALPIQAARF